MASRARPAPRRRAPSRAPPRCRSRKCPCMRAARGTQREGYGARGGRDVGRRSPVDRSLLGRVDLLAWSAEQERVHVLGEKLARLRLHEVQSIVVDEHHLLAIPLAPADGADLTLNALAY